jgi:hypothetical protein
MMALLCICLPFYIGLYKETASISDRVATKRRMISEQWMGGDMKGSGRGLIGFTAP